MNIIKNNISTELQTELSTIYNKFNTHFYSNTETSQMPTINSIVLCDKLSNLEEEPYKYILELLKKESDTLKWYIDNYKIVYIQLMNAPPECEMQFFHLDYNGDSISIYIPYVDLTDLNGTEYLYFYDTENYSKYFFLMANITNKILDKVETIEYLQQNNLIYERDYEFKKVNCNAFSIVQLPNKVLHRGITNKSKKKSYYV